MLRHSTRPLLWSTTELLWLNTNRKRSTSILIASILHRHFDFLAVGLPFRWHICDSIGNTVCADLKSLSMNDLQRGTVMSHVCLCLNSCLMQLCKPMQMSSCHLSWLLGRINPKNDFLLKKKSRNRFGWNRYIYKKKCITFGWKPFFREKYTCTLLFVVFFPFVS